MKKSENFLLLPSYPNTILAFRGNLIKLISQKYNVYVACPKLSKDMKKEFKKLNISHFELPLINFRITPIRDFFVFIKLYFLILKIKPKKILAYTLKPNFLGGIAARLQNIDFYPMFTGLGTFFEGKNNIFKFVFYKFLGFGIKKSKNVIFYNSANMELLVRLGVCNHSQGIIVNGSGLDINFYKTERSINFNDRKKITFLCSSRILEDKGIIEYLEAAKFIKKKYSNTEFLLLGWFQKSKNSIKKDFIQDYVDKGFIDFLGYKKDVRKYVDDCDVFVLPSYHEGMPRSALEAMSMSKALILSKIPGTEELIEVGKNGFFCDPKSTKSLITAMEKILSEVPKINEFGNESRKIIEEKFDDKIINNRLLEILNISI